MARFVRAYRVRYRAPFSKRVLLTFFNRVTSPPTWPRDPCPLLIFVLIFASLAGVLAGVFYAPLLPLSARSWYIFLQRFWAPSVAYPAYPAYRRSERPSIHLLFLRALSGSASFPLGRSKSLNWWLLPGQVLGRGLLFHAPLSQGSHREH